MPETMGAIIAPYNGTRPVIDGGLAFGGAGATILGRTTLGKDAWLGAFSVIRADGHYVEIGDDFHLGEHATVHIAHDIYPTKIGNKVTVGQNAVVHACTVGNDCVIERGAVILDGSIIGPGAIVTAGSIIFPRSELEGGWLYSGSPAKAVTRVTAGQLQAHHLKVRNDARHRQADGLQQEAVSLDCFVAPSARVAGHISTGEGVGIWYGCELDAANHRIEIGSGTNIQDNTVIRSEGDEVIIAPDVTIGHNVTLIDCRIASRSLIGIGSTIARGTVVDNDILVAAGSETEPGQQLTSGLVWAGRPARPIGKMDERKRRIISETLPIYRQYAETFRNTPHETLAHIEEE